MGVVREPAAKLGITVKTVPHPRPDEAYDLIAKMIVKDLIAKSKPTSMQQSTA